MYERCEVVIYECVCMSECFVEVLDGPNKIRALSKRTLKILLCMDTEGFLSFGVVCDVVVDVCMFVNIHVYTYI